MRVCYYRAALDYSLIYANSINNHCQQVVWASHKVDCLYSWEPLDWKEGYRVQGVEKG